MRIAVIGAGAMGSIYGGHLSLHNDVWLIDTNPSVIEHLQKEGLILEEQGKENLYRPGAAVSSEGLGTMDLVILFVKALFSKAALESNRGMIGENTYVLTLQNGSGHEDILGEFVPKNHIIIGTTEDNGAVLGMGKIRHGGVGNTNIGMLVEDTEGFLPKVKEAFDACGFNVRIHENIAANPYAWKMTSALLHEAVEVAHALGLEADEEELLAEVRHVSEMSPEGVTSICADLSHGRRTEVDTISGSVVHAAAKAGVPVPSHEFIVNMIHAMEQREQKG